MDPLIRFCRSFARRLRARELVKQPFTLALIRGELAFLWHANPYFGEFTLEDPDLLRRTYPGIVLRDSAPPMIINEKLWPKRLKEEVEPLIHTDNSLQQLPLQDGTVFHGTNLAVRQFSLEPNESLTLSSYKEVLLFVLEGSIKLHTVLEPSTVDRFVDLADAQSIPVSCHASHLALQNLYRLPEGELKLTARLASRLLVLYSL